jgi:hypothetical protein
MGAEFFRQAQPNFCRNTLCISKKFGNAWRKKARPDGVPSLVEQV